MSVFHVPDAPPPKRDKQLLIRVSGEERDRLDVEAKKRNLTVADLIRNAVNEYVKKPAKKTTKKRR